MATIQIREIPEEVYEVLRARARVEGRSIQSYMRAHLIDFAASPTARETVAALESALAAHDTVGVRRESVVVDLAADRR